MSKKVQLEIPNSIPCYCQEAVNYCGPAVAAMILEGYPPDPGPVDHPEPQQTLYGYIQSHNGEKQVPWWAANGGSDPQGLCSSLQDYGPEAVWRIRADADWRTVMFAVAYSVTQNQFPAAVLVYGLAHWVMIDGVETDVDPYRSRSVKLLSVYSSDPLPQCAASINGGTRSHIDGWMWSNGYWGYVETRARYSAWNKQFVSVITQPTDTGSVSVNAQAASGPIISAGIAKIRADAQVKARSHEVPYAGLVALPQMDPLLVYWDQCDYYLVPYGTDRAVRGAVLINAHDANFLQASVYGGIVDYISRDEAWRTARSFFEGDTAEVVAELVFRPSAETLSALFPVWQFRSSHHVVRVTQEGRAFGEFAPAPGGM